jgi:hypothetical protein
MPLAVAVEPLETKVLVEPEPTPLADAVRRTAEILVELELDEPVPLAVVTPNLVITLEVLDEPVPAPLFAVREIVVTPL